MNMNKRNLFLEITEGLEALTAEREGKRTLRTHTVNALPAPDISVEELVEKHPDTVERLTSL